MMVGSFLATLDPHLRARFDGSELESALRARWSAACAAWPQLTVPAEIFGAYWAARVPADIKSTTALMGMRVEELLLTCACTRGGGDAIRLLEARYFPLVLNSLGRMRLDPPRIDEVKQIVRRQLLVGEGDQAPRIANYAGLGDLGSWLSVTAVRAAYKLLRKEKQHGHAEDDQLADVAMPNTDIELAYTKKHCRELFRDSFKQAMAALDDREKNLLRQHYLDGMTIDQIGLLYKTHRATAARWMASARQKLLDHTRGVLMRRLKAPLAECESIIRMAQSQFEMSFHHLLAPARHSE